MTILILTIILVCSFIGMAVLLFRKIPILVKLPGVSGGRQKQEEALALKIKRKVEKIPGIKNFSYEKYLQKILSRVHVLTLKTDNKTSGWLERLRRRTNRKDDHNNDDYWDELKKAKDGK